MLTLFPFGSNRGKAYCLAVVKSEATFFDADSLNKFIISDYYVRCASWFGINQFFFIRWEIFFIRWESELNWIRNTAQLIRRVTNILVCKIEIIRSIFFSKRHWHPCVLPKVALHTQNPKWKGCHYRSAFTPLSSIPQHFFRHYFY